MSVVRVSVEGLSYPELSELGEENVAYAAPGNFEYVSSVVFTVDDPDIVVTEDSFFYEKGDINNLVVSIVSKYGIWKYPPTNLIDPSPHRRVCLFGRPSYGTVVPLSGPVNTKVCLFGNSGCGKTSLLEKLGDNTRGLDIHDVPLKSLSLYNGFAAGIYMMSSIFRMNNRIIRDINEFRSVCPNAPVLILVNKFNGIYSPLPFETAVVDVKNDPLETLIENVINPMF